MMSSSAPGETHGTTKSCCSEVDRVDFYLLTCKHNNSLARESFIPLTSGSSEFLLNVFVLKGVERRLMRSSRLVFNMMTRQRRRGSRQRALGRALLQMAIVENCAVGPQFRKGSPVVVSMRRVPMWFDDRCGDRKVACGRHSDGIHGEQR